MLATHFYGSILLLSWKICKSPHIVKVDSKMYLILLMLYVGIVVG